MSELLEAHGWFDVCCENPDGSLAWEDHFPNMATTAGLNHILNTEFVSGTQVTTWYVGLISNVSFSSLSAGDTMASHGGWLEGTSYSETVRQTWSPGSASGGSVSNSTTMNFTTNASGVALYGVFVVTDNTKGGTVGTLWATGAFSQVQSPTNGQVIKVTYTVTLTATSP